MGYKSNGVLRIVLLLRDDNYKACKCCVQRCCSLSATGFFKIRSRINTGLNLNSDRPKNHLMPDETRRLFFRVTAQH